MNALAIMMRRTSTPNPAASFQNRFISLLQRQRSNRGATVHCLSFIWSEPHPEIGDAHCWQTPLLTLKCCTWRTEVIFLTKDFTVRLASIIGNRKSEFLRSLDIGFLNFKTHFT